MSPGVAQNYAFSYRQTITLAGADYTIPPRWHTAGIIEPESCGGGRIGLRAKWLPMYGSICAATAKSQCTGMCRCRVAQECARATSRRFCESGARPLGFVWDAVMVAKGRSGLGHPCPRPCGPRYARRRFAPGESVNLAEVPSSPQFSMQKKRASHRGGRRVFFCIENW